MYGSISLKFHTPCTTQYVAMSLIGLSGVNMTLGHLRGLYKIGKKIESEHVDTGKPLSK